MASTTPTFVSAKQLAQRPTRKPRKLNYFSCTFCRNAKVKCLPVERSWPAEKCIRCYEKSLACSKSNRKIQRVRPLANEETFPSSSTSTDVRPPLTMPSDAGESIPSEPHCRDNVHTALLLLSLHALMTMALQELKSIGEDLIQPFKHDPESTIHAEIMDKVLDQYRTFTQSLQQEVAEMADVLPRDQTILCASLNLAYSSQALTCWTKDRRTISETIDLYEELGHFGIASVLQIKRLMERPDLVDKEAPRLIRCRLQLLSEIGPILERPSLESQVPSFLRNSQLFLPATLLKADPIMHHVRQLGLRDCLGRTTSHLEHDAGRNPSSESHVMDGDVFGRTALHLALYKDDQFLVDEVIRAHAAAYAPTVTGITALHLAAGRGQINCFRKILRDWRPDLQSVYSTDCTGRTFLEWAASCGNENIVDCFLGDESSLDCDWRIDGHGIAALRLAAQFGHVGVIRSLLRYDFSPNAQDHLGRTPFWYAVSEGRLEVMKCLRSLADVDHKDKRGCTPLAEAARAGFTEGIRYLLSLKAPGPRGGIIMEADPHSQDNLGRSPVTAALQGGHKECVDLLLGAMSAKGSEGIAPAANRNWDDIQKTLWQLL